MQGLKGLMEGYKGQNNARKGIYQAMTGLDREVGLLTPKQSQYQERIAEEPRTRGSPERRQELQQRDQSMTGVCQEV